MCANVCVYDTLWFGFKSIYFGEKKEFNANMNRFLLLKRGITATIIQTMNK